MGAIHEPCSGETSTIKEKERAMMKVMQKQHYATMRTRPVRKMTNLARNEQEDQTLLHGLASQMLKCRRRTKTNPVWNLFHIDPKFICRATCNICRKSMSRGQSAWQLSTSTLQRHLQTKHPTEWALACQVDGVPVTETSDQLSATNPSEHCSSRIASPVSRSSVFPPLEDPCVTHQDQLILCASESPEMSNSHISSPKPSHSILAGWEEDPAAGYNPSSLKKKCKNEPSNLEKIQSNDLAFRQVHPVSTIRSDFGPGELGRCAIGQGSSLESVQTPHKRLKRSKSRAWKFFLLDSQSPSKATCAVCGKSMSRGRPGTSLGTATLQRHLVAKHPLLWSMVSVSSDESEMLDYTLTFSLSPMSA